MPSSSISHKLYIAPEVTYGVTPSDATFKAIPVTGCTIGMTKNVLDDPTIRSDRQKTNVRHGTKQVGGAINTVLRFGLHDALLEAALCGTWSADQLTTGVVRRSFSLLRHYTDIDRYDLISGVEMQNVAISTSLDANVTANFNVIGKDISPLDSLPAGYNLESVTDSVPFTVFEGVFKEDGAGHTGITAFDLTVDNGHEARFAYGSATTIQPKIGLSNVTGNVSYYFENHDLLEKYFNGTETSLELPITDDLGNTYTIKLSRVLLNGGQTDTDSANDIVIASPYQALAHSADTQLKITRQATGG